MSDATTSTDHLLAKAATNYKDTVLLPNTPFPMKGDLVKREPERLAAWEKPVRHYDRGYGKLFLEHILQANEGCDFDFLR